MSANTTRTGRGGLRMFDLAEFDMMMCGMGGSFLVN